MALRLRIEITGRLELLKDCVAKVVCSLRQTRLLEQRNPIEMRAYVLVQSSRPEPRDMPGHKWQETELEDATEPLPERLEHNTASELMSHL